MSENQGGNLFVGFLIGAAVGAGIALLMAPASGEETRRQLGDTAKRLKDSAGGRIGDMKDALRDGAKDFTAAIDAGREGFQRKIEEPSGRRSSS